MKGHQPEYTCDYEQGMAKAQADKKFEEAYAPVPADGRDEEKYSPLVKKGK